MINESPIFTSFYRTDAPLGVCRASFCQHPYKRAFGGTHRVLASLSLYSAACTRLAVTGLALTVAASILLLSGCARPLASNHTVPRVAPVAYALASTRSAIGTTRQAIARAERASADLSAIIPTANRASFAELSNALAEASNYAATAESAASLTLTNLGSYSAAVTSQSALLNTTTARLDYLEPKYAHSVALLWKWRLLFLGTIAVILAFLFLKYGSRMAATAAAVAAKIP